MAALFVPKDRKSLFRQFLAGMYDAVVITDPNGHILEINPRAEEYFKSNDTILLSVGSIECHGKHLPLGTDTLIPEKLLDLLIYQFLVQTKIL